MTLKKLKDAIDSWSKESGESFWFWLRYEDDEVELSVGTARLVVSVGGHEGDGEDTWIIFRVNDQLYRKSGYYSSWSGTDWDGPLEEVEEYQRTITDYRAIDRGFNELHLL